jgi:hypothetical protein
MAASLPFQKFRRDPLFVPVVFPDLSVMEPDDPVGHIFDGIIMSDHQDGRSIFSIDGLDQF